MQNFTYPKLKTKNLFLVLFFALLTFNLYAQEGTRQVSPGNGLGAANANGTALLVTAAQGSRPGSPADSKMKVTIVDHAVENIYAGLMARNFQNANTTIIDNAYLRITDPLGTVVFQKAIPANIGNGFIENYNKAWNGPNIFGSNPAGYTPFLNNANTPGTPTVNPTVNGDYIIEVYTSGTGGSTFDSANSTYPFFDFTVANGTTPIPGRLWCKEWSFVTTDLTVVPPNFNLATLNGYPCPITSSFEGDFYAYTPDNFVMQVQFQSGFRPLGFKLSMNYEGVASTSNFANDRRSRNGNFTAPNTIAYPATPSGYKVFLRRPDVTAFPNGTQGNPAFTSNIYGCPGAYYIPYYSDQPGDFAILIDLNGTPGYQPATSDRILEAYGMPAGSNVMAWNGLNGLGAVVPPSFTAQVTVTIFQGRTNVPMVDAELNTNGLSIISIFPNIGSRKLYWDDTAITAFGASPNANANTTTGGVSSTGLYQGFVGPTHAWDGPNPTTVTPAPLTAGQGSNDILNLYDDYGNSRIMNTWFYSVDISSAPQAMTLPGCDNDGDGKSDSADLDDDNDGINDTVEYGALPDPMGDADTDGVPNYIDPQAAGFVDTDFDGIDDRYDTDLDGIINQFDLDSDNDGCSDSNEYYNNTTSAAAGQQFGQTGGAIAPTLANGRVNLPAATYTGSYANAIVAGSSSAVTTQPVDQSVTTGGNVTFTTVATGGSGVSQYQWQQSIDGGLTWGNITNGGVYSGATSSSLTITSVPFVYNTYRYRALVTETTYACTNLTSSFGILTVNNPPVANDDSLSMLEDGVSATVNVTTNDTDADGTVDVSTVDLDPSTLGQQTTFTSPEGNWSVSPLGVVTFTPNANFNGTASIPYTVLDDDGLLSNPANITITVTPVNDAPIVDNDVNTTTEDTPTVGGDLTDAGDSDPDGTALVVTTTPVSGPTNGTIVINPDGTYVYTPDPNFNGTDVITVQVCDSGSPLPASCVNQTLTITVTPVNDAPIVDNDVNTTTEDTPTVGGDLTDAGDSDPDGTALVVTTTPVSGPTNGTIVINPDGTYVYTPDPNFNGTDVITVEVCDSGSPLPASCVNQTLTITVTPLNDAPIVDNDVNTTTEDTPTVGGDLTDAGDSDPDGTALVVTTTPVSGPTNGTIVINPDGTYVYTPDPNFNGTDVITVEVCDSGSPLPASCVNQTLTITVTPLNDAPVAVPNNTFTALNTPVSLLAIQTNDTDVDGTVVTNTIDLDPATPGQQTTFTSPEGDWTLNIATGDVLFTPNAGYTGTAIIPYTIQDNLGLVSNQADLTVFVAAGIPPVVNDDPLSMLEDGVPATVNVTTNDTDADGTVDVSTVDLDPSTLGQQTTFTSPEGNWSVSPLGVVTFTPNANFNGTASIPYTVLDDDGLLSNPANITITVTPVNDAPIVDNDVNTTTEDTPTVGGDLTDAGDSDPDGTALVVTTTPVSGPTNGTIVINPDGTYVYTPDPNFNGTDVITVEVCDSGSPLPASCVNQTLTITVTPVNDAPIVDNDVNTTTEDTPTVGGDLTDAGDSDPDGTALVVTTTPVSGPTNGTIVINPDGTYVYTPDPNFNGTDVITVEVCDSGSPLPASCVNQTLTITVTPLNDAPIVDNDVNTTTEDTPTVGGDLTDAGDSDPDGTALVVTTTPVSGPTNGTIVINPDGTYVYTPDPNFNGTDVITVQVCDSGSPLPASCVNQTLTITVTPVNDAPIVDNDVNTTTEDTPTVGGDLTDAGDSDPDGTALVVTTTPVSGPTNGTIVINPDGTYVYTPDPNFNGTDVITVEVCDSGSPLPASCVNQTLTITVTPVNDAPIVDNDVNTTTEDTPTVGGDLTDAGDSDPDGTALVVTTTPVSGPTNGTIVINPDGTYVYTPDPNFNGTDVITVQVCDSGSPLPASCVNQTLTITVTAVNDAPVAVPNNTFTALNTPVSLFAIQTNDTDVDGTVVTNTIDLDPATPGQQTTFTSPEGDWTLNIATGDVLFTPNAGYTGTAIIPYTIQDNLGLVSNQADLTVFVNVGTPPVANDDPLSMLEDGVPATVNVTTNDTDADGTVDVSTVDLDPSTLGQQTTFTSPEGNWSVSPLGVVTFTPNTNFNGSATIPYTVLDDDGLLSNPANITITVTPVNDAPIVDNDVNTTTEDTPTVGGDLTDAGDSDPDGTALVVTTTPVSGPTNGTIVINPDGTYVYTPDPNFNGTDVITVEVCDSGSPLPASCVNQTLTITVTPLNDAPVVDNDVNTTTEDTPTVGGDLTDAGDSDPDGTALVVTTTPVSGPTNGTIVINPDGTYVYTPDPNFNGTDVITVEVCDSGSPLPASCVNQTLTITVTPVNDAPIVDNDVNTTTEDTPTVGGDLTDAGDSDPDGTALVVTTTPVSGPTNGTIVINPDGTYVYTPDPNFNGTDVITVEVCDSGSPLPASCVNQTLTITVTPLNDAPVAVPNNTFTALNTPVSLLAIQTNDTDVDGTVVTNTIDLDPATPGQQTTFTSPEGDWTLNTATGDVLFTPNAGYTGTAIIPYTIQDNLGLVSNQADLTVFVNVGTPPVANDDPLSMLEDGVPATVNVTTNDTDADGTVDVSTVDLDPSTLGQQTTFTSPEGNWSVSPLGVVTFTPNTNFNGSATIPYTVLDDDGLLSNPANITITVTPVNDAPIVDNDVNTTTEDTPTVGGDLTDAGDSDPDGTALVVTTTPVSGPTNGTIVINPDGTYVYTPDPNFNGTDVITVEVCDSGSPLPASCVNQTLTITVTPLNDAPVVDNDVNTTTEDTPTVGGDLTDAGDSDPDGTALVVTTTPVSGPTNGTIVINPDGTYVYTPDPNFNGTDVITVEVCDSGSPLPASCVNQTLTITVTPVNDAPIVDNDVNTTTEDTPTVGGDLTDAGDSDPDGTALVVTTTPVSGPTNGTIVINPDGTYVYTPDPNFNGTDVITVEVCDSGSPLPASCVNQTLTITVTPLNDAPVAVPNNTFTALNTPVSLLAIQTNDTDVDGTVVTNTIDLDPATPGQQTTFTSPEGDWTLNTATGDVLFTPNAGYTGTAIIPYTIQDNLGLVSNQADLTVVVGSGTTNPDVNAGNVGEEIPGNVATNDEVPAGTTYGPATGLPGNPDGTLPVINPVTGAYTFTPTLPGVYTFDVPVCVPGGPTPCPTEPLVITVVNPLLNTNLPVATNDTSVTPINTPVVIQVESNDGPGNIGGVLGNATTVTAPTNGVAVINPDGTITYTPNAGYSGPDSFEYTICETPGNLCATATVYVTVLPVGAPNTVLASDDYDTTTGVIPATGTVVTNDRNPDDLSAITAVTQNIVLAEGTFVLNADGTYVFTPAVGFSGTVNIPYTITDSGSPVATSTATLHIVVSILPVTTPDVNAGNVGEEIPGNVATNDEVPAGTTYGPATGLPGNPDGTLPVINPVTGAYTFTPTLPGVYTFDVPVCVSGGPTPCPTEPLVITVVNPLLNTNLPVATNDTSVTPINTPVVIQVESNDGPGNIGGVLGNATTVTAPTNGVAVINPDGTITYTPNAGYSGPDSFEYTICETPGNLCATATVYVTVLPVGAPNTVLASDDYDTTTGVIPATGTVVTNDRNPDDLSAITAVTQNIVLAEGTFVLNADGTYVFTPAVGFSGTVNIPYTITDSGSPVATSTATLHIVVSILPVTTPDVNAGNVGEEIPGNVATNDEVPAGTTYGPATGLPGNPDGTLPVINPVTGAYTFTPTLPGVYTFDVPVCVSGGPTPCPTEPLVITVVNPLLNTNLPVATNDTSVTPINTPVVIQVESNDGPGNIGGVLGNATTVTAPTNGVAVINPDGTITYTPNAGYSGPDSFEYTICETPGNLCATATVYVTVLPVGAPNTVLASDDYDTTTGVIPATGTVVTNDRNPDDLSAITAVTQNIVLAEGTFVLNADGTYVFTPAVGFSGTVNIPYTITDSGSPVATSTATLHIVVSILPVTTPDVNAGNVGEEIPGNVATNDEVPAGTTYGPATGLPGNPDGTLPVINPVTGAYTFTPTLPGVYTFDVPVCVSGGPTPCPTEPLVITVVNPLLNTNLPVATNDTSVTPINTPVVIQVESNDGPGNIGGVLGNATTVTAPTNGVAVINPDGTITYTPNAGYSGSDSFEYTICETPGNLCATATVYVTVLPVGAPNTVLASDDFDTATGVIPATGTVVTNDRNPDDLSAITAVTQNIVLAEGTFVLNADGTYVFTPAVGFSGTVNIPYTITDSGSPVATSTATLHIVVSILPVTTPDVNAGNIGEDIPGNVATNDIAPGATYGTPLEVGTNPNDNVPVMNSDGTYIFTTDVPGVYTFDVPVCVPGGPTPCPTVPLVITVVNPLLDTNLPVATSDTSVTPINTPVVIQVESNDGPGNIGGLLGNATTVTALTNGVAVINPDGTITYTPNAGYSGSDSFEYTICETPSGLCATATVYVTVLPVGAPNTVLASDDYDTATVLDPATGTVVTNDRNPDDLSIITAVTQNVVLAEGTFVLNANGSYSFVPVAGFSGTVDIPYTITDAGSPVATSTATLHIVVSALHDLIAVEDGTFYYDFSSTQNGTFPIFSNDTINDDVVVPSLFTFTLDNDGGLTGATIDASGNLIVPVGTDPGTYILTYTICENALAGNCDTATIIVNVFELEVFNAFTPGGGDINENFVIEGIQHFPNNSVEIYNRWGVLVYEVAGYDNKERSFNGTSEGRVTIEKGSKLPDGTYFYVIEYVDFEGVAKEKAGYLFIKRQ